MSMLDFYNAEILWPYITGEKDIPRNDDNIYFYRAARDFGRLCALTSLQKASSYLEHRPIDYEFVDIYNGIIKAFLATIEMGEIEYINLRHLHIIAKYIEPKFTEQQMYEKGLEVVLKGDFNNVYIGPSSENLINVENRKKIIGYFGGCLKSLVKNYGFDTIKIITNGDIQSAINHRSI